jgi:hypothetical protein
MRKNIIFKLCRIIKLLVFKTEKDYVRLFGILLIFSMFFVHAEKSKNVAVVQFVRGDVKVKDPDKGIIPIKKGVWIKEGSVVKTGARSVAKLRFIDKSTMNVGPNSEMKVEKFDKSEAGVIEVLSGKIRSQVSKNYMDMKKGKSKLFVKSKSAVMGIRGTDFIFAANKKNGHASAILFEGSVVFNKFDGKSKSAKALESLVDRGVRIKPGQFSVADPNMKKPTFPAKLDSRQFRALAKNSTMDLDNNSKKTKIKNIVPKGLTGNLVDNDVNDLKQEIKKNLGIDVKYQKKEVDMNLASGGNIDGFVKPADGSPLHIESSSILPVSSKSTFDQNTGEWRSQEFGIDSDGSIIEPDGYRITDDGKLIKEDSSGQAKEVVFDIRPPNEQPPLEEMPTTNNIINGPTPAGTLNDVQFEDEQNAVDGVAPSGQDWFIPNSQVNQPRFVGPDGSVLPSTKIKVKVQQDGTPAP